MNIEFIQQNYLLFILLAVWEILWKGAALWRAARSGQRYWFGALLVINTVGILPIVYLFFVNNPKTAGKQLF